VRGSALNPVVLERAGVQTSKAVILFASDKSDPDTDAATLTVAKQLWRVPGRFRLCYFLVESQNERLFAGEFDDAADLGRPHPAAVPRHLATMAAVQAARSSRVGDTITGLLRPDSGPMLHAGHTGAAAPARWSRLVSVVQRIAEELDVAVNPVSLSRAGGDEASVCPRPTDLVLPEDQVVFSAAQGVDWASFHAMLADRLDAG